MSDTVFLQVQDVVKRFEDVTAVNHVSFQVKRGESVGLVGQSGCGKSTLARVISGLEKPTSGRVLLDGVPYRLEANRCGCRMNMVFQNPLDSFDSHKTVFSSLYEALSHTRKISRKDAVPLVEEALEMVELPGSYSKRKPRQLSGGECQRIGIARAMVTEPELLICDEATSALDVSVQAQIIRLLGRIRNERDFTYLFIAHDLGLVATMCDRVLVMYRGIIVEEGPSREVMDHPAHPYTRLLVECARAFAMEHGATSGILPDIPEGQEAEEQEAEEQGCPYVRYCPRCSGRCLRERPVLAEIAPGRLIACHEINAIEG